MRARRASARRRRSSPTTGSRSTRWRTRFAMARCRAMRRRRRAWPAEEAVDAIERLARHDIQLVEQPCRSLEELAAVREAVEIPIAADEPVATAEDVRAAADAGACDAVNVKLAASGGFEAARSAIAAAREHGLEPYPSSPLDRPRGLA